MITLTFILGQRTITEWERGTTPGPAPPGSSSSAWKEPLGNCGGDEADLHPAVANMPVANMPDVV
jgi:hypothetical protein